MEAYVPQISTKLTARHHALLECVSDVEPPIVSNVTFHCKWYSMYIPFERGSVNKKLENWKTTDQESNRLAVHHLAD